MKSIRFVSGLMVLLLLIIVYPIAGICQTGSASLWTINSSGQYLNEKSWNLGSTWEATSYFNHPDWGGKAGYILFTKDGSANLWKLNDAAGYADGRSWNVGSTWRATSYTRNVGSTGWAGWLLWTKPGHAILWTLDADGKYAGQKEWILSNTWEASSYYNHPDWGGKAGYILWTTDGVACLWKLNDAGSYTEERLWNLGNPAWRATSYTRDLSITGWAGWLIWTKDGAANRWTLKSDGYYGSGKTWTVGSTWKVGSYETETSNTPAGGSATLSGSATNATTLIVKKAGSGAGTITAGTQVCDAACTELAIPYIAGEQVDVNVTSAADSYFAGWETASGVQIENIYYANPGDTVFAIFEQK